MTKRIVVLILMLTSVAYSDERMKPEAMTTYKTFDEGKALKLHIFNQGGHQGGRP